MFKMLASGVIATIFSFYIAAPATASDNGVAYALHTVRAEIGKVCMVGHRHIGKSPALRSKASAMRAASRHYSSFTELEYGSDWRNFNRAANRTVDCDKVSAKKWMCKISARPCRAGKRVAQR